MAWWRSKQVCGVVSRLRRMPSALWHLPTIVCVSVGLTDAQNDVARQDYLSAERRLLRVYSLANRMPPWAIKATLANLLMALVCLRLGNPQAAADLAPTAIGSVRSLRASANAGERAYLSYAGRLIYEEATRQLGSPGSLDIGVEYEDLDISKVRRRIRSAFPVTRSLRAAPPQLH
jgi:hypothetical protein